MQARTLASDARSSSTSSTLAFGAASARTGSVGALALLEIAHGEHDVGAVGGERAGGLDAESGGAAGDEDALSGEVAPLEELVGCGAPAVCHSVPPSCAPQAYTRFVQSSDIPRLRLRAQHIAHPGMTSAADLVRHFGAVQAQEFPASMWALGARIPGASTEDVERAIADREIVRTWPMRGTLHFVPAEDARWMIELMGARRARGGLARLERDFEVDQPTLEKSARVIIDRLSGGRSLTRQQLYAALREAGIETDHEVMARLAPPQPRGVVIVSHHAQTGLICYGVQTGRQPEFVLLDEWAPKQRKPARDEAVAQLTLRYFTSHGPATEADFAWWSGLPLRDIRAGIAAAGDALASREVDGVTFWMDAGLDAADVASPDVHLLPPFDEYTVAYKDRGHVLDVKHRGLASSGGIFRPIVVIDGMVVGVWGRTTVKGAYVVTVRPFRRLSKEERRGVEEAAARYEAFLGERISLEVGLVTRT